MMTVLRLITRKTRARMPQMICLILLLTVGVCFYVTLFTVYPALWTGAVVAAAVLCVTAGLVSLFGILPLLPAHAMRNKRRFFAVVLGMCGSCALLVFSLGFYDSIGNTQDEYCKRV